MTLEVGTPAPDFDMTASDGRQLRLVDFRGKKNVVVYFYPADFTLVCTRETCGFRDAYADLASKDTEVIGISVDDDASHAKFAEKYRVPFALVSDPDRKLVGQFDAGGGFLRKMLKKASRVTYVIDKHGTIRGVFRGELSAATHVDGVRDLIATLATG